MPLEKRRRPPERPDQPDGAGNTAAALRRQRSRALPSHGKLPGVHLRSVRLHPHLFRKLLDRADREAQPGDLVAVQTPQGTLLGHGLYNPRAEIAVRMLNSDGAPPGPEFWEARLSRAVALRRDLLRLDSSVSAYRVVHAEADGLPGLVIDRYADVLSAELYSLAMFQRADAVLARLTPMLGTLHTLIQVPAQTHGQEGFLAEPIRSEGLPDEVTISEFGTKFRVRFEVGHKTG